MTSTALQEITELIKTHKIEDQESLNGQNNMINLQSVHFLSLFFYSSICSIGVRTNVK